MAEHGVPTYTIGVTRDPEGTTTTYRCGRGPGGAGILYLWSTREAAEASPLLADHHPELSSVEEWDPEYLAAFVETMAPGNFTHVAVDPPPPSEGGAPRPLPVFLVEDFLEMLGEQANEE